MITDALLNSNLTTSGLIFKDKERPALIESYKEKNKDGETLSFVPLPKEETKKSNTTNNIFESINDAKKDIEDSITNLRNYATHFFSADKKNSDAYIEYRVSQLVNNLIVNFSEWEKYGTKNSYANISNIQDIVEESSEYLTSKDETRMFLGALEFIFENNNWDKITQGQLRLFIGELERFKEGKVNWESLKIFSQQIYRNRLNLYNDTPQEEKNQDTYL